VTVQLETYPDADAAAARVTELVDERASAADSFTLALSRASTVLLTGLAGRLPWGHVTVYQVDERVAPSGSPDRNATALLGALPREHVRPMPVDEPDLQLAAERYALTLPEQLDVVHLGLGSDGHTASLLPDDPVLDVGDRPVAVTREYEGYRRMTLTYPALEAARQLVWLVTGEAKREALRRLLERDASIPAGRIRNPRQLVFADAAASPNTYPRR
jgi:6-phosphogluconolactonase